IGTVAKSSYRADLGRLVAWVLAIRRSLAAAAGLANALSLRQIGYVVSLTGYGDSTMRVNATEVLSWLLQSTGLLAGPRSDQTEAILNEAERALSGPEAFGSSRPGSNFDYYNMAYNTIVALDDAKCDMRRETRDRFGDALSSFGQRYLRAERNSKASQTQEK